MYTLKLDVMKVNDLCEMMVVIAHIYRYVVCQLSKSHNLSEWLIADPDWSEGKMTKVEFG